MPEKKVVIVSRHEATINLLKSKYPDAEVVNHISNPAEYSNCLIIGNLPINMIADLIKNGNRFVLVALNVPPELRGKELGEEELKKYMKLYEIKSLELEEFRI